MPVRHGHSDATICRRETGTRPGRHDRHDAALVLESPNRCLELVVADDDHIGFELFPPVRSTTRDDEILSGSANRGHQRAGTRRRRLEELSVDNHGVDPVESPQHQGVHHQDVAAGETMAELGTEALATQPGCSRDRRKHDIGQSARIARHRECQRADPKRPQRDASRVPFDDTIGERPRSRGAVEGDDVGLPRTWIQARLDAFPHRAARPRLTEQHPAVTSVDHKPYRALAETVQQRSD